MSTKQEEARLILKLYELRRDETFRAARKWYTVEFNPQSAGDIVNLMRSGHPESAHYRMVTTYWDMAAAFVTCGAIDEELFHKTNTEYLAIYAKLEPFIADVRAAFGLPGYLSELERVAQSAPGAEEYFAKIRGLMKRWAESAAAKQSS
ncbi:MAG: hypothetical protein LC754_12785 [Acidobacteria bacterium]|nr:hypothetical protein [Acidobacteriota bacterium]